ncbi:MAG TPA: adenosylcobinamide-GDP ribazoletransferase [Actinomycetota bacterium]|nr:adenosylcobinamide-GDP ribazoletransferase [Actinomycetota bacterium]
MSAVREVLRSAAVAVTFLTAVPIGRRTDIDARELRGSLFLFPAVGALIGALTATAAWSAAIALPPLPAAALGVTAGTLVTAAMHLDGLADTADGVGAALSGGDPSTAMHDPRLGVFGGTTLALDLLLKVSVVSALVTGPRFPVEAIAAGVLGRAAALALMTALPYAGPESGTGGWTRGVGLGPCLVGLVSASVVGILTVGPVVGAMAATAVAVVIVVGRWSRRHRGGVTGDTLGATIELTETFAMTAALALR